MSFSQGIKSEICKQIRENKKNKQACLLGMLMFLRQNEEKDAIVFNTESEETANLFEDLIYEIVGTDIPVYSITKTRNDRTNITQKRIDDFLYVKKIYDYFINLADCDLTNMDSSYFCCDDKTLSAFFDGVYLVCGSVIDPTKEYHLELSVPSKSLCESAYECLVQMGFNFKVYKKGERNLLYCKDSETVEDFITFLGAQNATIEIMNIKIEKEIKNKINRISNCDYANLNKTVDASKRQIEDINYVLLHKNQVDLSEEMLEIARLKLDDPEASLRELAGMLSKPITRSGVNHRLQKFTKLAEELRKRNAEVENE